MPIAFTDLKGILLLGHDISLNVLFSFAKSLENHIQAAEATHHNQTYFGIA